jgi:hypothetical protein
MDSTVDFNTVRAFATALLIGGLIGIEREKRKTEEGDVADGLRTFILFAQVGAIAGWLSQAANMPWLLVGGLVAVAVPVVVGYILEARAKPNLLGFTTEVAAIATYLLGAMATIGHTGSRSVWRLPPQRCWPTSSRCTVPWPSSGGTTSLQACAC